MSHEIFQIFYDPKQIGNLDPDFTPYDNSKAQDDDRYEFSVFIREYENLDFSKNSHYGFVSWKFTQKAHISGREFSDFIGSNPGYDVYYLNPFPAQTSFKNVWYQGDHHHPHLLQLTRALFSKANYNTKLLDEKMNPIDFLFCNYWVGSKKFWSQYIEFIRPMFELLQKNALDDELRIKLLARADDKIDANYIPFIFERMISTLFATDQGRKIRRLSYRIPKSRLKKMVSKLDYYALCLHRLGIPLSFSKKVVAFANKKGMFPILERFL